MKRNFGIGYIIGLLLALFIGFILGFWSAGSSTDQVKRKDISVVETSGEKIENVIPGSDIPQKARDILKYIRENNDAPFGYVGGRQFKNRERLLPPYDDKGTKMYYREWDINPKLKGKNRGAERLITSKDGRAWYTGDHYRTFKEIK